MTSTVAGSVMGANVSWIAQSCRPSSSKRPSAPVGMVSRAWWSAACLNQSGFSGGMLKDMQAHPGDLVVLRRHEIGDVKLRRLPAVACRGPHYFPKVRAEHRQHVGTRRVGDPHLLAG